MSDLLDYLRRCIAHEGPISVAQYMETCLAHPEHGYYITRDPLGAIGDFTTAPEISQMFGELIGLWAAQVWQTMGAPGSVSWIELGPGRGTLSADALRAMSGVPGLKQRIEVHLVETSPVLRQCQTAALQSWAPTWHDSIDTLPGGPAIIIANEFFDALPIRQLVRAGAEWRERTVELSDSGELVFGQTPALGIAPVLPAGLSNVKDGDIVEVSLAAMGVVRTLTDRLRDQGGAALIIDYGHGASAPGDTLQAVKGHAFHDVLQDPGSADLTAHVDFAQLAVTARKAAGVVYGPLTQGAFLRALGIELRAEQLRAKANLEQSIAIDSALERLTAGDAMGRLFKVMAITAPGLSAPAGFEDLHSSDDST
jgi:NADH dehydrogenase [ubiquinone] 1 alpha subcomplex assembly factor 7